MQADTNLLIVVLNLLLISVHGFEVQSEVKCDLGDYEKFHPKLTRNSSLLADSSHLKPCKFDLKHQKVLLDPYPEFWKDTYLDQTEKYYAGVKSFENITVDQMTKMGFRAKIHAMVYSDIFIHKYDKLSDLQTSGGPKANQELCLAQLNELDEKYRKLDHDVWRTEDLDFAHWLDVHGKGGSGMISGNIFWTGSYRGCLNAKLKSSTYGTINPRYCVVSVYRQEWLDERGISPEYFVFKAGICLPESCDSIEYKNKFDLVRKFVNVDPRPAFNEGFKIHSIYCLPDDKSPVADWTKNPKAVLLVVFIACWLSLLVSATIKEELNRTKSSSDKSAGEKTIYGCLAITSNLRSLFSIDKASSLMDGQDDGKAKKYVDFDAMEGIKVLSMWYIIAAHVVMSVTVAISNARDLSTQNAIYYIINMAPAFAVNSFFCITGAMTGYHILSRKQAYSMVKNPAKWLAFLIYRYLRIMPVYLFVVAYTKILARYMGSGPFWDYGTSSMGQRLKCEEESWLLTLLFGANFEKPMEQCIPSAWYLANDFQFALVTPLLLALLEKSPRLGRLVLKASIAAGFALGFRDIFNSEVSDMRPIANFMLHGFKHYVTHMSANYTQPQYRIPAYLCGLLFGYKLYEYEMKRRKYDEANDASSGQKSAFVDWPNSFKRRASQFSLVCLMVSILTPIVGASLPFTRALARLMVAFVMPLNHILFATSVGIYLMLAATGNRSRASRFLGSPRWKPMSRLSLCAVLTNIEILNYMTQTTKNPYFFDFKFQLVFTLVGIIMTYLVSTALCILFEAPMRAMLNRLLAATIKRHFGAKSKSE